MTIGEIIARYCDEHDMSFRQFAEKCGLTSGYISMLVNNRNPKTGKPPIPTVKTYQKIASAMGIAMNDLLKETEKDTPTSYYVVDKPPKIVRKHYNSLADAIVKKLRESDDLGIMADDELWQIREDFRRNPQLRTLHDLQRNATPAELKQMEAFIRAIRSGENDE